MALTGEVAIPAWIGERWPDKGLNDGKISMQTALGSGYGHSRRAAEASEAALAELGALRATVDKLADAVGAAGNFDPADLKHAIRTAVSEAVESVTVRMDVTEGN